MSDQATHPEVAGGDCGQDVQAAPREEANWQEPRSLHRQLRQVENLLDGRRHGHGGLADDVVENRDLARAAADCARAVDIAAADGYRSSELASEFNSGGESFEV